MKGNSTLKGVSLLAGVILLAAGSAHADQTLRDRANAIFKPVPDEVTEIRGKQVIAEQVELGHKLWYETRLSRSHLISCNTCHNLSIGGGDNVQVSIGHGWQKGPRNNPTVLNAVFNAAQFWDGRAADLKEQAEGPLQAAVEMNNTPERIEETLNSIPEYVDEFTQVFGGDNPVSFDNAAQALAAFETTLITPNAPFDQFLKGDDEALTDLQKKGLGAFMDTGCVACHNGVNLGGQAYFPFGVVKRPGAAVRRQGALRSDQYCHGRVCLPCFAPAQRRPHATVFPQRRSLGSGAGGRHHGRQPAGPRTGAGRYRSHYRFPPEPDRRPAAGHPAHPAGQHLRNAEAG